MATHFVGPALGQPFDHPDLYLQEPPFGMGYGYNTATSDPPNNQDGTAVSNAAAFDPHIHQNVTLASTAGLTPATSGPVTSAAPSASGPAVDPNPSHRYPCLCCDKTYGRRGDMERHARKHQAVRQYQCPVQGCEYKGNYRKDKVNQHIENRHPGVARI